MPRWFKLAAFSLGVMGFYAPAMAQHDAMTELYGQAVHRYFHGDYAGAETLLYEVQNSGSEDPRVHYFLGLCKVRQGGGVTAGAADFEAGAMAEARGKNAVQVGLALQRIQGAVRAEIEKARLSARAMVKQQQLLEKRAAMEAAPAGSVPAPATVPGTLPPAADQPAESLRAEPAVVDPIQPEPTDTSNPFGDDPSAPAAPGTAPATEAEPGNIFDAPATEEPSPF